MIRYPKLEPLKQSRQTISSFGGINRNLRIGEGEFSEMENMTSDQYPVLSPRKGRKLLANLKEDCTGMIHVPGVGVFFTTREENIAVTSNLYLLEDPAQPPKKIGRLPLDTPRKRFAISGNTLIIVPDMRYVNLNTLSGPYPMAESWQVTEGLIEVSMCDIRGNLYHIKYEATTPPANPAHDEVWLNLGLENCLNRYDVASGQWIKIEKTYIKISGLGDHHFETGDGIHISGLRAETGYDFDGSYIVERAEHGCLVVAGYTRGYSQGAADRSVTIERKVPRLDFIVEAGNRLWGCAADGHEIYGCKLGDFRNWNCFQGLSTDSWVGSVGTPGDFTGAVVMGGYPVFFKENCKHKLWPSSTGAHQITTTNCIGVEKGSEDSLALCDGVLYYKSTAGVMADNGGGPVSVSQALGDEHYSSAMGGVHRHKYYLSMQDSSGAYSFWVFDIRRRLWHREDQSRLFGCASDGNRFYGFFGWKLYDLCGDEDEVSWMVQTGELGLDAVDQKYISRLTLRMSLEPGATMEIFALYDEDPYPVKLGQVYGKDLRSFSLPVRPRRCDHLKLILKGKGMCRVYSITKTLEKGSELS